MPDDLSALGQEVNEIICLKMHGDNCICADDAHVPPCRCGHPRYRHWLFYWRSGCVYGCGCEHYVEAQGVAQPLPSARWVNGTWWARFRRFLGLPW